MRKKAEENFAFTEYILSLPPEREPDLIVFDQAWQKLGRVLIAELQRRSLWTAPPRYLGVYGYERWSDPAPFEELMQDGFLFVFVERLASLERLAKRLDHIEGVAVGYLRNFLYDRQRRHDPLGYLVFDVLRDAVRRLIRDEKLHVLTGDPKVLNDTVLAFPTEADPVQARGSDLAVDVVTWCDDLMPELVVASARERDVLVRRLCDHVAALSRKRQAFRFKDVVTPLKAGVSRIWSALFEGDETGGGYFDSATRGTVRSISPKPGFEALQSIATLCDRVEEALPRAVGNSKELHYLHGLWSFVKHRVLETDEDLLPPARQLERLLGVPRKRIPKLLAVLGGLIRDDLRAVPV